MPCKNKIILAEIQKKRETMIDLAQKNGFTSDDTIKCSQELDQLIYQYQDSFRKNRLQKWLVKRKLNYMVAGQKVKMKA